MITPAKFQVFEQWVRQNAGKIFLLDTPKKFYTYIDSKGRKRGLTKAEFMSERVFVQYCKKYIDTYQDCFSKEVQMEFSPDYKAIKIYCNDEKFFNFKIPIE